MIMGQSSATAACMAIDANVPVQKVAYAPLREQLLKDGQVLVWDPKLAGQTRDHTEAPKLPGTIFDDTDAKPEGEWKEGSIHGSQHIGTGYIHDNNADKGKLKLTWKITIPEDGTYEVILHFPPNGNRATNVPVGIEGTDFKEMGTLVNERNQSGTASLLKRALKRGSFLIITLSNKETDGYVVADGVQLLKVP
jgi:hypothetical protein